MTQQKRVRPWRRALFFVARWSFVGLFFLILAMMKAEKMGIASGVALLLADYLAIESLGGKLHTRLRLQKDL